ncbi:sensor histidine kinase [Gimesia maris]|uniref:sensor histidine kinase n=1 Tax=Gimesia maris TaxID=122 RepID=UPI00241E1400|nr:sensor histidine kinase [Gimesia maris]|tara:strand:+ start:78814 stop:81126 length:2313 start_codon:yes stop_codon:yes gene_type:complete
MTNVNFRISSGLKTIIGRELITDDFIAVFELVKNSFDAHASRVDITFENLNTDNPSIIIRDNGKGMQRKDIRDKWLFVAYSAKREGTEDYRQKISSRKFYAGAKGIGRFSCDKLGSKLELITKSTSSGTAQSLNIDWNLFEKNAKDEFKDIPLKLVSKRNSNQISKTGTILKITHLREKWDRDKLLKLKRSLEKLINPNQGNETKTFSLYLHANSELATDKEVKATEPWNKINGKIENFLFEKLKEKSTHIQVSISEDGELITTKLEDRGNYIYKISEKNDTQLHGIEVDLYALNTSAKNTFTRQMGIPSVQFGSVFLFKNGFRIYPFGEEGEDSWNIDRRKQQGQARFFGTRDLIGRVEIKGKNDEFQEASSRDGGLIQNEAVKQLREFFTHKVLRRLERFAIDVIKFGNKKLPEGEFEAKVMELILQLTKSKSLVDVDYNSKILDILQEASEKSLKSLVTQFRQLAIKSDNPQLERDARKAEQRIRQLEKAREEAEAEAAEADLDRQKAVEEAEEQKQKAKSAESTARNAKRETSEYKSQNLFLQSLVSSDTENLVGLHHYIGIAAGTIQNYVHSMASRIRSGKPVTTEMFLSILEKISLQASQIASSARFGSKANFSLDAALINNDIVGFVREYVLNVCQGIIFAKDNKEMKFKWNSDPGFKFDCDFRPFEVVVMLDNLISNSKKAGANVIDFDIEEKPDSITIVIRDNGKGIPEKIGARVFELGYTTTNGSGFGLYHAASIAKNIGGELKLINNNSGAEFAWEINK